MLFVRARLQQFGAMDPSAARGSIVMPGGQVVTDRWASLHGDIFRIWRNLGSLSYVVDILVWWCQGCRLLLESRIVCAEVLDVLGLW